MNPESVSNVKQVKKNPELYSVSKDDSDCKTVCIVYSYNSIKGCSESKKKKK